MRASVAPMLGFLAASSTEDLSRPVATADLADPTFRALVAEIDATWCASTSAMSPDDLVVAEGRAGNRRDREEG